MKSLWITLFLFATCTASGNSPSLTQTPENLYQKGVERTEKKEDAEATQHQKTNFSKRKQPQLDRIETALSRGRAPASTYLGIEDSTTHHLINGETLILTKGTQSFLHNVLQFLKTAGITIITGGILTILAIYLLIMLIILLRVFRSDKRVS